MHYYFHEHNWQLGDVITTNGANPATLIAFEETKLSNGSADRILHFKCEDETNFDEYEGFAGYLKFSHNNQA